MPSFKIRPAKLSMHGRQLAINPHSGKVIFSVCKRSRIKTMSLRHNLEVSIGDDEGDCYVLEADLMGRTIAFKNTKDELVAIASKSTKTLILNQVRAGRPGSSRRVAAVLAKLAPLSRNSACSDADCQAGMHTSVGRPEHVLLRNAVRRSRATGPK
jgi:hypothetical protein